MVFPRNMLSHSGSPHCSRCKGHRLYFVFTNKLQFQAGNLDKHRIPFLLLRPKHASRPVCNGLVPLLVYESAKNNMVHDFCVVCGAAIGIPVL